LSLAEVSRFDVPIGVIDLTERALRAAGEEGYEVFVLWSGISRDRVFQVRTPHLPAQNSYRTPQGLLVRVEGAALHKLNAWLYEHGEQLAVQVHAHPEDAFHSDTDDTYPIVTELGSLSLVAAHFCRGGLLDDTSAAFRLTEQGWDTITSISNLVRVVP
jgi:hypothetical protein